MHGLLQHPRDGSCWTRAPGCSPPKNMSDPTISPIYSVRTTASVHGTVVVLIGAHDGDTT